MGLLKKAKRLFKSFLHNEEINPYGEKRNGHGEVIPDAGAEPNIILTTRCNGRCIYCSANGEDRHMSIDSVRNAVTISGHNAVMFEGGEPLLCPDLEYWTRTARKHKVQEVHILTNGYLLSQKRLDSLMDAGATHFHFNFPSHIKELHEQLTGLKDHFEKQVESMSRVLAKKPDALVLVCVINSLNYKYLSDYVEFVAKKFPGLFYIAFNSIKVMGNVRDRRDLVPRISDAAKQLKIALKKARELHVPCLVDGFPLCLIEDWEAYSRDIEHIIRGNPTYLSEKAAVSTCKKCTLSGICAGIRKDYVEVHGSDELHTSRRSPEQIIEIVKKGQLALNQEGRDRFGNEFKPKPFVFYNSECNGKCIYCLAANDVAMSESEINKVLSCGYNEISILGGEPLLNKDLEDRVRKIASSGVKKIQLFTNGLLLTEERLKSLVKAGVTTFNFNFPAHTPKEHEKISGLPGNVQRQTEAIRRACAVGPESAVLVCVVNSINYKLLSDYVLYAKKNFPGLFYILFIYVKAVGRVSQNKWVLPKYSEAGPEIIKAFKTAEKEKISCLIDGLPLCFMDGYEKYSWDIDHNLRGNNIYPTSRASATECMKCSLSEICVGPRTEYAEIYGTNELRASSKDKNEILRLISNGQIIPGK